MAQTLDPRVLRFASFSPWLLVVLVSGCFAVGGPWYREEAMDALMAAGHGDKEARELLDGQLDPKAQLLMARYPVWEVRCEFAKNAGLSRTAFDILVRDKIRDVRIVAAQNGYVDIRWIEELIGSQDRVVSYYAVQHLRWRRERASPSNPKP